MATASDPDDVSLDEFLEQRGHETETVTWDRNYNKLQCPECGGLHDQTASECGVCGWAP
jgi:hypothetical protein